MIYWKDGFYGEQSLNGDRYLVDDKLYAKLEDGIWEGKVIKTASDGSPYLSEPDPVIISVKEENAIRRDELLDWFKNYDIEVIKSIRRNIDITVLHQQAEANALELKQIDSYFVGLNNVAWSLYVAKLVLPFLFGIYNIQSVVDFGCGAGYWLQVSYELGVGDIIGFDKIEFQKEFVLASNIFNGVDFNTSINLEKKYDLVICLGAEDRFSQSSSDIIIDTLTKAGDLILFSSTSLSQVGDGHINEQDFSYWDKLFSELGFSVNWDVTNKVKSVMGNDNNVPSYYKSNLLVYYKEQ